MEKCSRYLQRSPTESLVEYQSKNISLDTNNIRGQNNYQGAVSCKNFWSSGLRIIQVPIIKSKETFVNI